jgi:hypothetical protein
MRVLANRRSLPQKPLSLVTTRRSREEVCTGLRELHERAALVQHQPAVGDGAIEACLVLRRRAFQLEKKRPLDP